MKISVIGLGKLGAPLAAVFADKGYEVLGCDVNQTAVDALNEGRPPVPEPHLDEYVRRNRERLRGAGDVVEAVSRTDCTFVVVPTPSRADGSFSMEFALRAARDIGAGLRAKRSYHLVVLSSTVMPGATESSFIPELERASGKQCGPDFGVCYNPEFIALGSVIHDFLHPDMILIGESDKRAGDTLESIQRAVCPTAPVQRMNFVNAELTKLSINTFVTTKISYANMLAEVCETLPGGDVGVVTRALGCDTRIGPKYLKGALGYGGPCFPRDNQAFIALCRQVGLTAPLAEATDSVNRRQPGRLARLTAEITPQGGQVGVFGLSYKPDTSVVEQSQGVLIAAELASRGMRVAVHDPLAMEAALTALGDRVRYVATARGLASQCRTAVITTPWPEYRNLKPEDFSSSDMTTLIDCWGILDPGIFGEGFEYLRLGSRPAAGEGAEFEAFVAP